MGSYGANYGGNYVREDGDTIPSTTKRAKSDLCVTNKTKTDLCV